MSDKFKISDLQSAKLQELAENVNYIHGDQDIEGKINKKELKKLQELLNGNNELKSELDGESDDIKKLFGYTGSVKADNTRASEVVVSPVVTPAVADNKENDKNNTQKSKEQAVKDAYYKYRGIDPITREPMVDKSGNPVKGLSPKAAYEAVEKDFKDNKEYKDAVKSLRKYSIDAESVIVVLDAINRATSEKSKDVKAEAEKILKAEGNWDKHTKKALNGKGHSFWKNARQWAGGRDSDMKLYRKAQAAGNKAAAVAENTYSEEQFKDAIGKRSPLFEKDDKGFMKMEKLVDSDGNPLVVRQADGSFDINGLSAFIGSRVGADNTLNRQQNKADAEIEEIRAELRKEPNNLELTARDTRQLVEFCGYRVEHKNWVRTAYAGALGALVGAGSTAGSLATQPKDVFKGEAPASHQLNLTLKMDDASLSTFLNSNGINKMVEEGTATVTKITGGAHVAIDQKYVQPFFAEGIKHIGLNTLKAAGIGALAGMAASLLDFGPSELNVFNAGFKCTTYEDFIKKIDARNELSDAHKIALKQIAMQFIIDGENGQGVEIKTQATEWDDAQGKFVTKETSNLAWDCDGFKAYLNEMAGYSSNLNKIELLRGVGSKPVTTPTPEPVPVPEPEPVPVPEPEPKPVKQAYVAKDTAIKDFDKYIGANKHAWQDLVKMYDCISDQPYKVQSRFLKAMQGFKKNDFTYEQIMQIVNVSKPGRKVNEETKAAIKALDFITDDNFDVDMFAAHVNTPGAVGDDDKNIIAIREIKNAQGEVVCTRDDSRVTRTIDRNGVKGGSKGTTAGQYQEETYWHRDSDGRVEQDANQGAQSRWAEGQRQQGIQVNPVQGGRDALDRIGRQ